MEGIGEFCDRMGMDNPKTVSAATELEHARHAINTEIDALRAEAARYRAALESVLEQIGTSGGFPPDLTIKAIENIADRALHPEEER